MELDQPQTDLLKLLLKLLLCPNSGEFLELCVMPKDEDILQLVRLQPFLTPLKNPPLSSVQTVWWVVGRPHVPSEFLYLEPWVRSVLCSLSFVLL